MITDKNFAETVDYKYKSLPRITCSQIRTKSSMHNLALHFYPYVFRFLKLINNTWN